MLRRKKTRGKGNCNIKLSYIKPSFKYVQPPYNIEGIAKMYDYGYEKNQYFIVMELLG